MGQKSAKVIHLEQEEREKDQKDNSKTTIFAAENSEDYLI